MYPPGMSYQIYRIERGLTLTHAEQRAADVRAGEVAATLGRQWRALGRLLTLAGLREALRLRNVPPPLVAKPVPLMPVRPGSAKIIAISNRKSTIG